MKRRILTKLATAWICFASTSATAAPVDYTSDPLAPSIHGPTAGSRYNSSTFWQTSVDDRQAIPGTSPTCRFGLACAGGAQRSTMPKQQHRQIASGSTINPPPPSSYRGWLTASLINSSGGAFLYLPPDLTPPGAHGARGAIVGTAADVSQVPIPAAAWLFGTVLLGAGAYSRKKAR